MRLWLKNARSLAAARDDNMHDSKIATPSPTGEGQDGGGADAGEELLLFSRFY